MGCKRIVRIGRGMWGHWDFCWEGHKYVCEDDFAEEETCLIYRTVPKVSFLTAAH